MPKVKYMGPFAEVTVGPLGVDVLRNHQIEVDHELFDSLTAQADWVAVEDKPKKKAPTVESVAETARTQGKAASAALLSEEPEPVADAETPADAEQGAQS